ncbi:MAG TPA: alpha/beta fold hydrolase [Bryobacteraceae bacterium]|nr:alpha/beta fold hydrolase [Bryobacteraceae bacterium]
MQPFVPYFRNPHLATIAGNYWRRDLDELRFPVEANYYATEPDVQVLVHSQQPQLLEEGAEPIAQLILVHGLEGSSAAGYACSLAQAALTAGCAVHRFNMRSCAGTEHLSGATLYHSGQTSDLLYFLRKLPRTAPIFLVGFSLGGNVSLKLAGELGASGDDLLAGVMAVSTPIDLAACVRQIDRPSNLIYARRFVSRLKERVRTKARHLPGFFDLSRLDAVRSIYDFDDRITAQVFGFGSADNYYATQSANQFLDRIRVPTLLVQAKDDPMIPFEVYDHPAFSTNPHLRLIATDHGGHLGFIAKSRPRFWLDGLLVNWLLEVRNKLAASFVSHS